jgi:hypothetical protein
MTIEKNQLRSLIKRVLRPHDLWSQEAEDLLMGTAAQESHLGKYIAQINGPAKGIFQMEPATEKDLWEYIARKNLTNLIGTVSGVFGPNPLHLEGNLLYQIIIARIFYRRVKEVIPEGLVLQAKYYKKYWNTELGKATVDQYVKNYTTYA